MLSDDVRDALERVRRWTDGITPVGQLREQLGGDFETLADAMLKIHPVRTIGGLVIRWDDEITPERLIACGAEDRQTHFVIESGKSVIYLGLSPKGRWVIIDHNGTRSSWYGEMTPSNMGKLFELMELCKIEVPT